MSEGLDGACVTPRRRSGGAIRVCRAIAFATLILLAPSTLQAQTSADLDRPNRRREEIPIEVPESVEAEKGVPALNPPAGSLSPSPLRDLEVHVSKIRLRGNTLVPEGEVQEVLNGYVGRTLSSGEIERLRRQLTQLYVDRGFVTSGVLVPDQSFENRSLVLNVIEGRLGQVRIRGHEHLRPGFIRRSLGIDPSQPLNVHDLEASLKRLQSQEQIERVNAALRPGLRLGESVLELEIAESAQYLVGAGFDNHRSTVVGEYQGHARIAIRNLAGWGDVSEMSVQAGSGFTDVLARYAIALPAIAGRLSIRTRYGESEAIEKPLDQLEIESDFLAVGLEYAQRVWENGSDRIRVGASLEYRRSRSSVAGTRFSFSEGADRGISKVVPLRLFADWVHRESTSVTAIRAQVSQGLPILDATNVAGRDEDATFTVGLLQMQWANRFNRLRGLELIARSDLQISSDPLLSLEQFSLGGQSSVRGYRENEAVRDNGVLASLELRLPLLRRPDGRSLVQAGPFADFGYGWNDGGRPERNPETLAALGLGLRVQPWDWLRGRAYWGYPLASSKRGRPGAQDSGFHFALEAIGRW